MRSMMALQQERGSTSYSELQNEFARKSNGQPAESKSSVLKWSRMPGQVSHYGFLYLLLAYQPHSLTVVQETNIKSQQNITLKFSYDRTFHLKYQKSPWVLPERDWASPESDADPTGVPHSQQVHADVPWGPDGLLHYALFTWWQSPSCSLRRSGCLLSDRCVSQHWANVEPGGLICDACYVQGKRVFCTVHYTWMVGGWASFSFCAGQPDHFHHWH